MDDEGRARRDDDGPIRVGTTEDVRDADEIITTVDVEGTEDILVPVMDEETARRGRRRRATPGARGDLGRQPDEDEEVNPIGSYESWDQSGQGLDAAGSGMTGDAGSIGLTGTGFEDDLDLERPAPADEGVSG